MKKNNFKIGVLDSGRGGLSVVSEIVDSKNITIFDGGVIDLESIKECDILESGCDGAWEFVYFADNANLPYGTKTSSQIVELTNRALKFFDAHEIDVLIIACNTICANIPGLDLAYPVLKIIDSNIASLSRLDRSSRIALFATKSTIDSKVYPHHFERLGFLNFYHMAASELVEMIESDDTSSISYALRGYFKSFGDADFLLLGCTHFPLVKDAFASVFKGQILKQSAYIYRKLAFSASLPLSYTLTLHSTSLSRHASLLDFANRVLRRDF